MNFRGGARHGAGRPRLHVLAEDCRRLSVGDLYRAGLLHPGEAGTVRWSDRREASTIFKNGALTLYHALEGKAATQMLAITTTTCNFGGCRPWFVCARCSGRASVLFLRGSEFMCRSCGAVNYESQRLDALDRALRRRRKDEERLAPGGARPRGMRRSVFSGIRTRLANADRRYLDAMSTILRRLGGGRP